MNVHVIDHPLIQHKLTIMRMKETGTKDFRELLEEISMLMAYEITRDFPLKDVEIETPICKCKEKMLAGKKVGVVPILRAGLGMLNGVVNMIPAARVGHVGMYRDPKTLKPVEYYCKLPGDVAERTLVVVDQFRCSPRAAARLQHFRCSRRRARSTSSSCASSPRQRASASSTTTIQMCRSTSQPSTRSSTKRATSYRASAMQATASLAHCNQL